MQYHNALGLNSPMVLFNPLISGKIFSLGTLTLSKTNSPVAEARKLHLLCVSGVENPSIPRSTTIPLILPDSSFAQTTAISAKGALLIHILHHLKYNGSLHL